uniref:Uncharacterized protein n=1 Tax=Candidatus Methanogaster sp. ANME-2c ERB4 TaxID=2759911 RepID=A0A7G9Y3S1_9EURY|nr:hypothetical protein PCHDJDJP_00016 [Methanosarcinales archaeon ANME-2c ERB4]QNO42075.1 hypothetical protein NOEFNAIN_00006 [Methanosarcinales archaeon ANME-2c ERB4]QNO42655.1 hypothetical protein LNAFDGMD_00016 [Methanosarcinales archaeon ANME-2c ERB4]QNO43402.1 hypothetical protein PNFJDKBC_00013 [Methanosarcinales archaeon ANME-2c ERB4]QNO48240.1 hypothetical protein BHCKGNAA_00025 [Methanosarcinales archaeon ANME-2c ERB4]
MEAIEKDMRQIPDNNNHVENLVGNAKADNKEESPVMGR